MKSSTEVRKAAKKAEVTTDNTDITDLGEGTPILIRPVSTASLCSLPFLLFKEFFSSHESVVL